MPATCDPIAVTVVAAIEPSAALGMGHIMAALACPQENCRETDFLGRLSTRIHADAHVVAKLRTDFGIPQSNPARWVQARLLRERGLSVYPPDRTWFLHRTAEGHWQVGTAALRRRPMHLLSAEERDQEWLRWSRDFLDLYLHAAVHGWRLDEGPSNFARDVGDGPLRYLDDDLYPWDGGTSLAMALVVQARRNVWLDTGHAEIFASALRKGLQAAPALIDLHQMASTLTSGGEGNVFLDALSARLVEKPNPRPSRGFGRTLALLGDIHANIDALEAVLAQPQVREAEQILVLGDTMGYGPDPEACIERLAGLPNVVCLRGNHDEAILDEEVLSRFTYEARLALEWTRERATNEMREWISALPLEIRGDGWLAVHGAPVDPQRMFGYVYQMTCEDNFRAMDMMGVGLAFHGHTHIAGAWVTKRRPYDPLHLRQQTRLELAPYMLALVCPGSVGQPRDGSPGAAYAIYDAQNTRIDFHRVAYDISGVRARMQAERFPVKLIERLGRGA